MISISVFVFVAAGQYEVQSGKWMRQKPAAKISAEWRLRAANTTQAIDSLRQDSVSNRKKKLSLAADKSAGLAAADLYVAARYCLAFPKDAESTHLVSRCAASLAKSSGSDDPEFVRAGFTFLVPQGETGMWHLETGITLLSTFPKDAQVQRCFVLDCSRGGGRPADTLQAIAELEKSKESWDNSDYWALRARLYRWHYEKTKAKTSLERAIAAYRVAIPLAKSASQRNIGNRFLTELETKLKNGDYKPG